MSSSKSESLDHLRATLLLLPTGLLSHSYHSEQIILFNVVYAVPRHSLLHLAEPSVSYTHRNTKHERMTTSVVCFRAWAGHHDGFTTDRRWDRHKPRRHQASLAHLAVLQHHLEKTTIALRIARGMTMFDHMYVPTFNSIIVVFSSHGLKNFNICS